MENVASQHLWIYLVVSGVDIFWMYVNNMSILWMHLFHMSFGVCVSLKAEHMTRPHDFSGLFQANVPAAL